MESGAQYGYRKIRVESSDASASKEGRRSYLDTSLRQRMNPCYVKQWRWYVGIMLQECEILPVMQHAEEVRIDVDDDDGIGTYNMVDSLGMVVWQNISSGPYCCCLAWAVEVHHMVDALGVEQDLSST